MITSKKTFPYIIGVLIFSLISCLYMSPALKGLVIATSDGVQAGSAVHEAVSYHEKTGNSSFWTGCMFSGMPNYQIGGGKYASSSWLKPLSYTRFGYKTIWGIVFVYCLAFFVLLRSMGINRWISITGAIATAFSSYFFIIIGANHFGKTPSIAYMSLVSAGLYLIFNGHRKWGVAITMVCTAVGMYPHPQMAYYMCFIAGFFWLAELWKTFQKKDWKTFIASTSLFAGAFLIGMGTGTANTFANMEYSSETMRGGHSDLVKESDVKNKTKGLDLDYATSWSYGIDECWTFLIPNYMGGSSNYPLDNESELYQTMIKNGVPRSSTKQFCQNAPTYWGDQPFTAGPVYMGVLVCFLFVLGLLILKGPYKWALLGVTLLSVCLSWGHHWMGLTKLFFTYMPMYNKFRAVSSILVIAEITMPLLGFLALKQLIEEKERGERIPYLINRVFYSAGILIALLFLAWISTSGFVSPNDKGMFSQIPDWLGDAIVSQREAMFKSDLWRAWGLVLVCTGILWLFLKNKNFKTSTLAFVLGALVLVDMWPVDKRYMNNSMFSKPKAYDDFFAMQPYEKQIEAWEGALDDDTKSYRVFNLATNTFNDARTSYRLKSIGGYSAAKLRRYQDLIDEHLSKMHWPVINMLNTKYIIHNDPQDKQQVSVNPDAMGNAWFVDTLKVVNNPNEECDGLMKHDLHTTAIVGKDFAEHVKNSIQKHDATARVKLTKYTPEYIEYDAQCSENGTIVFSEIYYPYGWKALVDGKPVEHFRVNYMLRALNIEAGTHHIRFEFRPDSVAKGDKISLCFIFAMYAILMGMAGTEVFKFVKKRK